MNKQSASLFSNQPTVRKFFAYGFALIALCWCTVAKGQDIENILKQKIITVNGGVSANTTFYNAQGIPNRRDPFYWMVNTNLNFNILGIIQAPFSMTLSQQKKKFSQPQPFNRFGLSPRYKSITAHLGYRTMNFSEYSLAGNMFFGAGVDVVPKDGFVRFSAMVGRLTKAVEKSAQQGLVFAKPAYQRMGYGMKVGLGRKKHLVDLIFFKAADDPKSIEQTEDTELRPEENLVVAVHGRHELNERLSGEFEYAYSMYTSDREATQYSSESFSYVNNLGGIFRPNMSTEFSKAFTGTLNYNGQWYQANVKYRKIDPGYRTLGSSFLNNGLKDLTGGISWGMFDRKINVSTNGGLQESTKENSVVRIIYSVNVSYAASDKLNLNATYSNFSTSTRQVQLQRDIRIDSVEFFQVTRSGSAMASYKFGTATLSLTASIQDATDNQGNASTFYNLNFGHQMKIATQWQASLSGAYNKNISTTSTNTSYGPVVNINRSFLKGKVRSACGATFLKSFLNEEAQGEILNLSMTNSIRVGKKHSLSANMYYLNNRDNTGGGKNFSEVRAMVNYGYSF